jgi:hypothetical protein
MILRLHLGRWYCWHAGCELLHLALGGFDRLLSKTESLSI